MHFLVGWDTVILERRVERACIEEGAVIERDNARKFVLIYIAI